MSGTVDTRTVEMRFDNKNFESNVKQSMSTLDKLKKKLKLDGASKGLEEVEKTSKKLDFKDLDKNIDGIGKKFSALETIATGAFLKIGMSAAEAGMKIVKSFTIDQVSAGFNKYGQMTSGVQMIMANLADDTGRFIDEASKMDYVNSRLKELMTFTDETSYRFTDMMDQAGKWVGMGIELDDVVTAMEGIATMSAMAGKTPAEAGQFYDAFSNVMQMGYVSPRYWYTLSRVFTAEAKKRAIAIGEELGVIEKGTVTVDNFKQSFTGKGEKSWLNKDVLVRLFKEYGAGAAKMIEYMQEFGVTGSEALRDLAESDEEFANSIGYRSLRYAQEAKTFGEAMDATADAVSTKWSQIFQNIFGDYLEAKELWTNFSEDLWEIFAGPLDSVNEIMTIWKLGKHEGPEDWLAKAYKKGELDKINNGLNYVSKSAADAAVETDALTYSIETLADGSQVLVKKIEDSAGGYERYTKKIYDADKHFISGRTVLLEGFKNIMNAFFLDWEEEINGETVKHLSVLGSIKEAFLEIFFPDFTGENGKQNVADKLLELTEKFRDFTEKLKPLGEKLKKIFSGFFRIFKIVGKVVKAIIKPFKTLFDKIFGNVPENVLKLGDSIADWLEKLDKFLDESGAYETIANAIDTAITTIVGALDWLSQTLTGLSIGDLLQKLKKDIKDFFNDFDFQDKFDSIKNFFGNITEQIQQLKGDKLPDELTPFQNFCLALINIFGVVKKILGYLSIPFKKITDFIAGLFGGAAETISDPKNKNAVEKINPVWEKIKKFYSDVVEFFKNVGDKLKKVGKWFKEKVTKFFEEHDILDVIESLAKSGLIASLTSFIFAVSGLIRSFSGIGKALKRGLNSIRGVVKAYRNEINASAILEIAMSIGIIAGALWVLAQIPSDKLGQVIGLIILISGIVAAFMLLVDKIKKASNAGKNLADKVKEGPLAQIKDILVSTVGASIFANDATAKFVKICAGILLAAIALRVVVGAISKMGDAISKLAKIPPDDIKQGGKIAAMILLAFGAFALLAGTANKASSALFAAVGMYILVLAIQKLIDVFAELGSDSEKLSAVRRVVDEFKDIFKDLQKLVTIVVGVGLAIAVIQAVIVGFASLGKKESNNSDKVLKQFGKTFTRIAASLLIIAIAFAAMAGVMRIMRPGDFGKIAGTFAIFIGVVGLMLGLLVAADRFGKGGFKKSDTLMDQLGKVFTRIAASLLIVAAAFAIMALATKNMSDKRFDQIRWMFLLFAIFVGVLTDVAIGLEEFGHGANLDKLLDKFGKVFLHVAASLLIIAAAFAVISLLPFNNTSFTAISIVFGVFIALVGGIAIAIAAIAANAPDEKPIKALNALSVLVGAMALSLLVVAAAFAIIASIDFKEGASFTAISIVLGSFLVIVGAIAILAGTLIKEGTAIIGIAAVAGLMLIAAGSLVLVALAIKMMADSATPEEMTAAIGVISAFGILVAVMAGIGILVGVSELGLAGVPEMALLMVAAAGALVLVGYAISQMSDSLTTDKVESFNKIVLAFGILVGAIALIGILVGASTIGLAGVPEMALLIVAAAGALALVGYAISQMSDSLTEDKISGFIKVLKAFAMFLAALAIIGTFGVAGIPAIAGLLIAIGAACLMAGVGISLIVDSFATFVEAFGEFVDIIATKGPEFVENISDVIDGFLDAIIQSGPKLSLAIGTLIDSIFRAAIVNMPKIVGIGIIIISSLAVGMKQSALVLAESAFEVLKVLVVAFYVGLGELIDVAVGAFISFIESIADTIRNNAQPLVDAGKSLIEAFIEAFLIGLSGMADTLFGEGNIVSGWIKDKIPDLRLHFGVIPDDAGSAVAGATSSILSSVSGGAEKLGDEAGKEAGSTYASAFTESFSKNLESDGSQNISDAIGGLLSGSTEGIDITSIFGGIGLDSSNMLGAFSDILPSGEGFPVIENWMSPENGEIDYTKIFGNIPEGMQTNVIQPISDAEPDIRDSSENIAKAVEEPITSLDSYSWGEDLMTEFGNGMLSKLDSVRNISSEGAQIIRDILGFSEPKKGPLSNFHTYAPDMIKLWCSGVRDNLGLVDKSSSAVASRIDDGLGTALNYLSSLIDDGMSDELTIRPVMDLSAIQNGAEQLDSMLNNRSSYSLQGTANLTSLTAGDIRTLESGNKPATEQPIAASGDTINNTFNITSNDPDAVAKRVSRIIQQQVNRKQAVWAK